VFRRDELQQFIEDLPGVSPEEARANTIDLPGQVTQTRWGRYRNGDENRRSQVREDVEAV
jgi:hypothetical protein